jgi:hypothetical protein
VTPDDELQPDDVPTLAELLAMIGPARGTEVDYSLEQRGANLGRGWISSVAGALRRLWR